MGVEGFAAGAVFFCENVSEIDFIDGVVYLTDDCGQFKFTRAMRLSTFARCVRGAYELLCEIETRPTNVRELPRPAH